IVIELGIVLLAVMTEIGKKSDKSVTGNHSVVNYLSKRFNEDDIRMFVERSVDRYKKTGKLPKVSELTIKLRPIRQAIVNNGFDHSDLEELFGYYRIL
ncbi:hypothetical protein MUP95_00160, partial [bacterium]|nr:hypothetical protein [bacterium]